MTWSGGCFERPSPRETERSTGTKNDELIQIWETRLQDGHPDGPFVQRYGDGALEADGQHMNGEMHGTWTWFLEGRRPRGRSLCERRASRHLGLGTINPAMSWGRYDSRTGDGWAGSMTRLR